MNKRLGKLIGSFGLCLCGLGLSGTTLASVIFSNFSAGLSYDTSNGNPVGNGFDGNFYSQGSSFVAGSNAVLGSMEIALNKMSDNQQVGGITVNLTAAAPDGALLESWSLDLNSLGLFGNSNAPLLLGSLLNPTLVSGDEYWVTVSLGGDSAAAWNWSSSGDTNPTAINAGDGGGWFTPSGQTPGAFQLDAKGDTTQVPEPATLALVGLALAGLSYSRRKQ
ncbi:PEP-CTERM sorting domain-containing protein [Roseateles koreensis]|uniref:PEP-CTERM sorting domain-containing protein n=1 Tax=Roseateles koreensis TaxID=2987526 RepID=A0ABT5KS27_9BURK|nr:PEP-CTERM sorting domain-containing protein [Roseateles koreensis]MDC8785743.1 PEP-CTERM sorting domain-containing protein [Roseateles koreensis]